MKNVTTMPAAATARPITLTSIYSPVRSKSQPPIHGVESPATPHAVIRMPMFRPYLATPKNIETVEG